MRGLRKVLLAACLTPVSSAAAAKLQARLTSRDQVAAEASQLKDRATTARTDAERAEVHKRAQELLGQPGRE
jgi:hypothetical protein